MGLIAMLRLDREMTARSMIGANVIERWMLVFGTIPRVATALEETTALRPVGRRRYRPGNDVEPLGVVADVRHRAHQALGVRMMRPREQLVDVRLLDYLSRVHDDHALCHFGDDAEVVGRSEEHT